MAAVAFWGAGHIGNSLGENNLRFRHTYPLNSLCGSGSYTDCLRISVSNILGCQYHDSSGNKFDVLPCIEHFSQIVYSCIRVGAAHTFYKGRNNIIVIVAFFVILNHSFLDAL